MSNVSCFEQVASDVACCMSLIGSELHQVMQPFQYKSMEGQSKRVELTALRTASFTQSGPKEETLVWNTLQTWGLMLWEHREVPVEVLSKDLFL